MECRIAYNFRNWRSHIYITPDLRNYFAYRAANGGTHRKGRTVPLGGANAAQLFLESGALASQCSKICLGLLEFL